MFGWIQKFLEAGTERQRKKRLEEAYLQHHAYQYVLQELREYRDSHNQMVLVVKPIIEKAEAIRKGEHYPTVTYVKNGILCVDLTY